MGPVVEKTATGDEHWGLTESLLLYGNARAARAGEIIFDRELYEPRRGTPEDLHGPAIGVEEVVLQDGPVGLQGLGSLFGEEGVGSSQPEPAQEGVGRDPVAKIDHVVHHRRVRRLVGG